MKKCPQCWAPDGSHFPDCPRSSTLGDSPTPKQPHIPAVVLTGTREHRAFLTVDGMACTVPKDAAPFIVRACNNYASMLAALERALRLINEAHPKFNWGASALDANAIQLLNEVPREVRLAIIGAKGLGLGAVLSMQPKGEG